MPQQPVQLRNIAKSCEKEVKHMAMHKIAVISDTHNLLRPEVLSFIEGCEMILHAGDISTQGILDSLQDIRKIYAVRGNNDRGLTVHLPLVRQFELYGFRFCMTHIKRNIPQEHNADIVIYGHSHRYSCSKEGNTLYLNPGSCGPRRFNQEITMAVLTLQDRESCDSEQGKKAPDLMDLIHVEKILIPNEDVKKSPARSGFSSAFPKPAAGNMAAGNMSVGTTTAGNATPGTTSAEKTVPGTTTAGNAVAGAAQNRGENRTSYKRAVTTGLVRMVCGDVDRERTIEEIAARRHIDPELAEQIARLYLTHQNVTPEQIMAKMGL